MSQPETIVKRFIEGLEVDCAYVDRLELQAITKECTLRSGDLNVPLYVQKLCAEMFHGWRCTKAAWDSLIAESTVAKLLGTAEPNGRIVERHKAFAPMEVAPTTEWVGPEGKQVEMVVFSQTAVKLLWVGAPISLFADPAFKFCHFDFLIWKQEQDALKKRTSAPLSAPPETP